MIERFLRLLDTFKEYQVSNLLRSNRQLITQQLKGPYFSKRARDYFANDQAHGEPYIDFTDEPRRIVQIKQLINALYHAEMAFIDLENVNLRNGPQKTQDLSKLYFNTIHHAYLASYLLTHVDIDFMEVFGHEIHQVQGILHLVQKQADGYEKQANALATRIKEFPLSSKAGTYAGIAVDQMKPRQEGFDYNFLSKFSAELPGYIQTLRLCIDKYSAKISAEKPEINKQKLQELQEHAIKIIFALDDLKENNFFIVFKLLNYINIIRNIITLSTTTFQQIAQFNETSQNVVRDNLAILKYDLLPRLFALADSIEEQALLTPGTLSKPMMQQVKPLYDLLITYASMPVNFKSRGMELLMLQDARFLDLRLDETRKRLSKIRTASVKAQCLQTAFNSFYEILALPEYKAFRISQLPPLIKSELARHYRYISPIIEHHSVVLNHTIITGLTQNRGWSNTFKTPVDWYYQYENTDQIGHLLKKKSTLSALFARETVTPVFHKQLNQDILQHIIENSEVTLTPDQGDNPFILNEKAPLGLKKETQGFEFATSAQGDCLLKGPAPLTTEQAFLLAQYYDERLIALTNAQKAYQQFMAILDKQPVATLSEVSEGDQKKLRQLYPCFQAYWMKIMSAVRGVAEWDKAIIDSLTSQTPLVPVKIDQLTPLALRVNAGFKVTQEQWEASRDNYLSEATKGYQHDVENAPLTVNTQPANRAHYVLKNDTYSRKIADYRKSLFQFTAALNLPATNRLQLKEQGVPFPELENSHALLAESRQLLNIKRIFNALYYLQQIATELEKLNDQSSESKYVYHLLKTYHAINHIHKLSLAFYEDPHSRLVCHDLMMKISELYQFTRAQTEPYLVHSDDVGPQEKAIRYNGLWYTLQAFMVIPEHIEALNYQTPIPAKTLTTIRLRTQQIAIHIEKIINDSNSYFKLLLDTPVMYRLFMELKAKFLHFSAVSHEAVMDHLEEISSVLFTRILTETDLFEAKLALKPGELATTMKAILDQFYQGLVEPLGLVSARHLDLVFSLAPIKKRQIAVQQRTTMAELKLKQISPEKEAFSKLHQSLTSYNRFKKSTLGHLPGPPPPPNVLHITHQNVVNSYQAAFPFLEKAEKELSHLIPKERGSYPAIEDLFNKGQVPCVPVLENIVGLSNNALIYWRSQSASRERDEKVAVYSDFVDQLEYYLPFSSGHLPSTPELLKTLEKKLITAYARVLPDLYAHQANYNAFPSSSPRHPHVDTLLNEAHLPIPASIPDYFVDFVANLNAYYHGLHASHQFEKETAHEQTLYLQTVEKKDAELNEQYKTHYLQKTFEELASKMAKRRIGLLQIHSEYEQQLHTYLLSFNQEIIANAKSSDDIRKTMILQLITKTRQFQDKELRNYLHLDKILSAIQAFSLYLDHEKGNGVNETSVYEVQDLIDSKVELLTKLKNIALDSTKSTGERLTQLNTSCGEVEFYLPLTKQRPFVDCSWLWIKNCLINLLALLRLYTPSPTQRFHDLHDVVQEKNKPPMPSFANQFGLFAKSEPLPSEPGPQRVADHHSEKIIPSLELEMSTWV